jgi:hypothetical protein
MLFIGEVYEILKSVLQIYVRMSSLWLWVVFIVERLINILVVIAKFFIYFLQLFDSFTTSHEDLSEASLQSLQCGGSAVKEPLEAMNFLVSISDRCVSFSTKYFLMWTIFFTPSVLSAFNL